MAKDLFSVPIFFIVFRETLEAAIIVSVLLGLVEQLVLKGGPLRRSGGASTVTGGTTTTGTLNEKRNNNGSSTPSDHEDTKHAQDPSAATNTNTNGNDEERQIQALEDEEAQHDRNWQRTLVKKLRWQIFLGALTGFIIALCIGAAFIAVWFTQASDLWSKSEDLWEGIFDLIASIIIFVMGVTMLRMDRAKAKWRVKLMRSFEGKAVDGETRSSKWVLFLLPCITVLREGMEAVVFVGGVSLGQKATSIPIAAIVGILAGVAAGYLIYAFASRSTLTVFLIVITNFLLLIGAGLFSKAVGSFETHHFDSLVGGDVDETGDGPGSYNVHGNVWHLDCCNPENNIDGHGWDIFGAIFGWTNNGTLGTILSYVFYWLAVIAALVYMKYTEGRTTLLGRESAQGARRRAARERRENEAAKEAAATEPPREEVQ